MTKTLTYPRAHRAISLLRAMPHRHILFQLSPQVAFAALRLTIHIFAVLCTLPTLLIAPWHAQVSGTQWIPLRLTPHERELLSILEGVLTTSEYTDKVDVAGDDFGWRMKPADKKNIIREVRRTAGVRRSSSLSSPIISLFFRVTALASFPLSVHREKDTCTPQLTRSNVGTRRSLLADIRAHPCEQLPERSQARAEVVCRERANLSGSVSSNSNTSMRSRQKPRTSTVHIFHAHCPEMSAFLTPKTHCGGSAFPTTSHTTSALPFRLSTMHPSYTVPRTHPSPLSKHLAGFPPALPPAHRPLLSRRFSRWGGATRS